MWHLEKSNRDSNYTTKVTFPKTSCTENNVQIFRRISHILIASLHQFPHTLMRWLTCFLQSNVCYFLWNWMNVTILWKVRHPPYDVLTTRRHIMTSYYTPMKIWPTHSLRYSSFLKSSFVASYISPHRIESISPF